MTNSKTLTLSDLGPASNDVYQNGSNDWVAQYMDLFGNYCRLGVYPSCHQAVRAIIALRKT